MKQKGRRFHDQKAVSKKAVEEVIDIVDDDEMLDVDVASKIEQKAKAALKEHTENTSSHTAVSKREQEKLAKKNRKEREKNLKEKKKISAALDKKRNKSKAHNEKVVDIKDAKKDKGESKKFYNRVTDYIKSARSNKKTLFKACLILLLLVVIVFVYSNSDVLSFSNIKNWVQYGIFNVDSDQQFPRSTEGDVIKDGNFKRINSDLVFASDTQFVTMNSWGRCIYKTPQSYSNPVLVTAADSDLSLVYNLGGKGYSIYNIDATVYNGTAEENILVADISESGAYALVTQKYGYLSKLYVYSKDNKPIYTYSFADYYITSVSIDSSGETAVLSGLSAHEGKQISAIYVLDFSQTKPQFFKEFNNNVIYYVDHLTNNYCCIIGENATYTLDIGDETFNTLEYGGKKLTAFTTNTDTNTYSISLSRSGDGHKCDILNFSTSGNLSSTISTDLNISSISTYKSRVAVLSNDTVSLYSKDGSLISQVDAGLDPRCVVLYSRSDAYVLGVSEIRRIDL